MKIAGPALHVPLPVMRSVTAPAVEPAAGDSLSLVGGPAPADARALADTGAATAAGTAYAALAHRDLSREELQTLAESLGRNGMRFTARRKIMWWHTGWGDADAQRVAKVVDKGLQGRLMVKPQGLDWLPVENQGDLKELEALHGSGAPEGLPEPELARALKDLEQAGIKFRDADSSWSNKNMGAYGAYNVLTGDAKGWTSRTWDQVLAHGNKGYNRLESAEDALMLAFVNDLGPARGLSRPEQAEALKILARAGLDLGGQPFDLYKRLGTDQAPKTLPVSYRKERLAEVPVADLGDPVQVAARMQGLKKDLEEVQKTLGEDHASEAWRTLRDDGSGRPFPERLAAYRQIHEARVEGVPTLYREVLQVTPEGRDLAPTVREALDLARVFKRPTGSEVVAAWQGLRELARDAKVSPAELKLRFMTALAHTQASDLAVKVLKILGAEGDYGNREAAWLRLAELPKAAPLGTLAALEAMAEAGGLPGDVDRMLALAGDGSRTEAPAAYKLLQGTVPPENETAFTAMFEARPEVEALKPAWQEVARFGPARADERGRAWRELLETSRQRDRHGADKLATRALSLLREGPDFAADLAVMKRMVPKVDLRRHGLEESWKSYLAHPQPAVFLSMLEATGTVEAAGKALGLLARPELQADGRPVEDRAEALGALISLRKGDLEAAADDLRFLAAWTPNGRPMGEQGRRLAALEKTGVGGQEARKALAAAETTAPGGRVGPTTYASLEAALKAAGSLAEARGFWTWLEQEPGSHAERMALLPLADGFAREGRRAVAPEACREVLEALEPLHPDAAARETLAAAAHDLSGVKDGTLRLLREVAAGPGPCGPRLEAFRALHKEVRHGATALALWPEMRAFVGTPDFADRCAALRLLHEGRKPEDAAAALALIEETRQPGESWKDLAALQALTGEKGFAAARRALGEGTVEGDGLAENTRFFVALGERRDREDLWETWRAVSRPVGRESTADRREAFTKLLEASPNLGDATRLWTELTGWLAAGESLDQAASACADVARALKGLAAEAVKSVREHQRAGRLGSLPMAEALERLVSHVGNTMAGGRPDVQKAVQRLLDEMAEGGNPRDIHVSDEGVRIGEVSLGRS